MDLLEGSAPASPGADIPIAALVRVPLLLVPRPIATKKIALLLHSGFAQGMSYGGHKGHWKRPVGHL